VSLTRFNKRAVRDRLNIAARGAVNDLTRAVAVLVEHDAARDTEFLASTVEAIPMGETGAAARSERRVSRRSGRSVDRVSHQAAAPADAAVLHVGADYATLAEQQDPFIWPNVEAAASVLPGVVAKRRIQ
jgi:hypothetical protein